MVVKFIKWSSAAAPPPTRKFNVKVKSLRLQGLHIDQENDKINVEEEKKEKVVILKIKWEGEQEKFGFGLFHRNKSKLRKDFSSKRKLKKGDSIVEWDNDEFENICCFTIIGGGGMIKNSFESPSWIVSFSILYGDEKAEQKGKLMVAGKVSVDIAEVASKMEAQVERKLPVKFHIGGFAREAILIVQLSFDEIREVGAESRLVGATTADKPQAIGGSTRVSTEVAERLGLMTKSASFSSPVAQSSLTKKKGFFSFKRRRLSIEEPLVNNRFSGIISGLNKVGDANEDKSTSSPQENNVLQASSVDEHQEEYISTDSWVTKEITSRDRRTKLKTSMFFASFDQRSDKAAGESACSVLATVISYWLHSNKCSMPTQSEFDNLIIEGSAEWRKFCGADTYMNDFPNKHFDLETIMNADIRPISISHNQSFIAFFGPEKFDCLKGVRSFDEIWDEIEKGIEENEPRVYIMSWNDHFFVMKFEKNDIYIIDTLGERLFEGCNQAYILKFDESSEMVAKDDEAEKEEEELICNGRECCKEFIKRFLAAIPLEELEEEEKKKNVSYFSLHHRLQIEFNFSYPLYPISSSSTSSPFSSSTSTPSPLHG
ncbi:hypothetical protein Leryth_010901 [Lithospermum erythrorhizon]|nr:hypothetical protein Leryth_010901 [Lithospermum erythrorhizon]